MLVEKIALISAMAIALSINLILSIILPVTAQPIVLGDNAPIFPKVKDQNLRVELVTDGLNLPTSMTFIGRSEMLVTQKGGAVILISFQNATAPPTKTAVMKFNVTTSAERGLLGVAAIESNDTAIPSGGNNLVFFYLTEARDDQNPIGNRVYRYDFENITNSFSNAMLLLDLPAWPGAKHNGGKIIADSGYLYLVIGDLNRNGTLQNYANLTANPDDTSVIIRINPDGIAPTENPFEEIATTNNIYRNLSEYYAYGIRNSFGLAIDPITGVLWDTENGPAGYDEINVVKPGFNSGWEKVIGPIERRNVTDQDLVHFQNSSYYADPVFSWRDTVGVTDIEFLRSELLGTNYTNNIFVGDYNNGTIYYFEVNATRSGLEFDHPGLYDDLVASNDRQVQAVIFGTGFSGGITDIATGPDGYLYVLTYGGAIYRIGPK